MPERDMLYEPPVKTPEGNSIESSTACLAVDLTLKKDLKWTNTAALDESSEEMKMPSERGVD